VTAWWMWAIMQSVGSGHRGCQVLQWTCRWSYVYCSESSKTGC